MVEQRSRIQNIFDRSLDIIINILIVYIIAVLIIGLGRTIISVSVLFTGTHEAFARTVTDILTFLVILELFKGFVDYFKDRRFRLHHMLDPAIVFVIREMIIGMYGEAHQDWQSVAGFGLLILSLGVVRTLAVRYSPEGGPEN